MTGETPKPLYKRSPRGCFGIFFVFLLVAAAIWGACLGYFVQLLEEAQAQLVVLEDFRPRTGSKFYDFNGQLLGEYAVDYRQVVSLPQIPLHVQKAVLAGEDHVFYEHRGVRPLAIVSAAIDTLRGNLRGGSTITMQIVRNIDEDKLVGKERTVKRKLREILIALQLEREYTKDEILELYLNQVYLGGSARGVEAAARQYFGKHCEDLSLSEAALVAQALPSPQVFRPDRHPERAERRRGQILRQMLDNGFITQEEMAAALAEPVRTISAEDRLAMLAKGEGFWGPNRFLAPYFVEEARRRAMDSGPGGGGISKDDLLYGGLEIYTTLDYELQRAAEEVLFKALGEFDEKKSQQLERQGREEEFVPVSGALVCIDNRPGYEGFVRALVGGRDWEQEQYNTVTQAKRQPGSSVKPFVWAAALADKMTPSTIIVDEPFVRRDAAGNIWAPGNFDGKFTGPITLRRALEQSRNIISIKLVEKLTMPYVRSFMVDAGIRETPIRDVVGLTIALGTPEITVLEQCTAYSTFAKNGAYAEPLFLKEIRSPDGFVWKEYNPVIEPEAIPANVAYVVTYLMEGVARWGTGARTRPLGDRPRAGKTGTTNDSVDVWFCGFTKQYTTVVWMGYRGGRRSLGRGVNYTGGRLACPIWTDFMLRAHEGLPEEEFEPPPGVEFYQVEKASGLKGGSFREAFIVGTQPPTAPPIIPDESTLEPILDFQVPDVVHEGGLNPPPEYAPEHRPEATPPSGPDPARPSQQEEQPLDLLAPFEGL